MILDLTFPHSRQIYKRAPDACHPSIFDTEIRPRRHLRSLTRFLDARICTTYTWRPTPVSEISRILTPHPPLLPSDAYTDGSVTACEPRPGERSSCLISGAPERRTG